MESILPGMFLSLNLLIVVRGQISAVSVLLGAAARGRQSAGRPPGGDRAPDGRQGATERRTAAGQTDECLQPINTMALPAFGRGTTICTNL